MTWRFFLEDFDVLCLSGPDGGHPVLDRYQTVAFYGQQTVVVTSLCAQDVPRVFPPLFQAAELLINQIGGLFLPCYGFVFTSSLVVLASAASRVANGVPRVWAALM